MATGIGNLPYTMPPVSPFDVITSQAENEKIANIESLANGTGIGDGAVTAGKIDFTTLKLGKSYEVAFTSNANLSTSYVTKYQVVIPAADLPGTGTYQIKVDGYIATGFGGNSTAKDSQYRVTLNGSTTGVSGAESYITQSSIATFTVGGAITALVTVPANTNATIAVQGMVSSTAGTPATQPPRSYISATIMAKLT